MKSAEFTNKETFRYKAGLIPYVIQNNEIKMLFMVPSDQNFGGNKPCIAKGGDEPGETPKQTAIRECKEELGLEESSFKDIFKVSESILTGLDLTYKFYVYAGELKEIPTKINFGWEVGTVHWLTLDEYKQYGRENQLPIIQQAYNLIKSKTKKFSLSRLFNKFLD